MSRIGEYTLHTIETGRLGLDGGAMFGIVPKPLWEKKIPADSRNRIPLNMRCLLLEGSDRLILIDNGLGDKFDDRFSSIYAVDTESSNLKDSLAGSGFSFSDVTDVILTHLHFDHCGGTTVRRGDSLELTFPNALIHSQRSHWEWARHSNLRERASFLPENLDPLADSDQLNLIDGQIELYPGIELLPVDGHTRDMQLVKISDDERTLVFMADLLPTHAHLSPAWNMAYDLWPMTTIKEKARLLEKAISGGWTLFFEHDPEIAISDVEMLDRGPGIVNPRVLEDL